MDFQAAADLLREEKDLILSFAKLLEEAETSVLSGDPRGIDRLVSEFDMTGAKMWNNMAILAEQAGSVPRSDKEECSPGEVELVETEGFLCVKTPLLSSINKRHRNSFYSKKAKQLILANLDKLPEFTDKVIVVVNAYSSRRSALKLADPGNLDSKKIIDAIAQFIGGDGANNTAAYISACVVGDSVSEGCYVFVLPEDYRGASMRSEIKKLLSKKTGKYFHSKL